MRKLLAFSLATAIVLLLSACFGAFREKKDTDHYVDTDQYTLSVKGHRIANDEQISEVIIQVDDDTVRLYDDVATVAQQLDHLTIGFYQTSDLTIERGDYVLRLELINKPGSNHADNAKAALKHLRDWGYIKIDTSLFQNVTVVRQGSSPADYNSKYDYGVTNYDIAIPQVLLKDSVDGTTLGEWMDGWMDARFETDNHLFHFLSTHGYDTVHTAPLDTQFYPTAQRKYGPNNGLVLWPF